ncbi:MAG: hypothetical protein ACR2P2_09690 [Nakamurella sp.]
MEIDGGLIGAPVVDGSGRRIGEAAGILVDPYSLHVGWLLVAMMGGGEAVVPATATSANAAGQLVVPFDAAMVAGAPTLVGEVITSELAAALRAFYGLSG